ncbi:MAG: Wzy polymerase domain-containing protein [Neisseria sp.]|uniref:PglL family O-oligosaccharyltransferase n=1 Tax=Neisseria sp. TaxID=192066 RepID=UPI0026DA8C89|nr:O-antigen ligase family protein [Neisseria sp.]MDO4641435.1 Wzy polymerase domain-containing protein [Neisseria sp.]
MILDYVESRKTDMTLLVFGMAFVCIVPFMSIWRVGPLSSFYLESASLLFALLFALGSAVTGRISARVPEGCWYFFALAVYWWLQARIMALPYPGMSDMAVWSFVVIALAIWACRGWVLEVGQERVVTVFASVLVTGALLQSVVCILQFTGWAVYLKGYVLSSTTNNIMGQLAQRNHLGHYLMWGVVASAFLWSQRRVSNWFGCFMTVYLALVMGMVNSRSLFVYVAALAILALFWRWRRGSEGNRSLKIFLFALLMVVAVQLSFDRLMDVLGIDYFSALDRMESNEFASSPREVEWVRAWHIFLAAPIWGHGWESYSQQSFLTNVFPTGWRNDLTSVLYTHSHNIVLQLLADMGLVGTLLVFGGLAWVIYPYFKKPVSNENFFPLALLTVSLCHSLLEYPLWYVYFLVPVGLMLGVQPAEGSTFSDRHFGGKWMRCGVAVATVFIIVGLVRLGFVYNDLVKFNEVDKKETAEQTQAKINGMLKIAATEPLLRYYAQLALTRRASPTDETVQPWAVEAALQAMRFRPYANANVVGMYLYRIGDKEGGRQWMRKMYEYYPTQMPFYVSKIDESPALAGLRPDWERACAEYAKVNPKATPCKKKE